MDQNELKKAILWAEKRAKMWEDMAPDAPQNIRQDFNEEAAVYRIAAGCMWAMLERTGYGR